MFMLRTPQEPDCDRFPQRCKGVVIPKALNFSRMNSESDERELSIQKHREACTRLALELSDLENEPHKDYTQRVRSETVSLQQGGPDGKPLQLKLDIDTVRVAGVAHEGLLGVRHMTEVPLSPKAYLDGYNRVNYTDVVDNFAYLVELVEDLSPSSDEEKKNTGWSHVAYTADKLAPILSERDFVTFDFVSEQHNLLVSRSCEHAKRPKTPVPTWWFHPWGPKRTYRSPLFYFLRAIPIPNEPNRCKVIQFQFSDVGGGFPVQKQVKAIIQFGIDNTPKVARSLINAVRKGIRLGEREDEAYMKDPLKPSWIRDSEVLLGIKD